MNKTDILIFGGTTEGRKLSEFCARHGIPADVCVVTQAGSDLIEAREGLNIHVGPLDAAQMQAVMETGTLPKAGRSGGMAESDARDLPKTARDVEMVEDEAENAAGNLPKAARDAEMAETDGSGYRLVIDATHPYAREATQNIRAACRITQTPYLRVRRESEPIVGPAFDSLDEMIVYLNRTIEADEAAVVQVQNMPAGAETMGPVDGASESEMIPADAGDPTAAPVRILSALGGKSLAQLTAIREFEERLWVRVLPSDEILPQAIALGYPAEHIIMGKGPFSVPQNIVHLQQSSASFLLTKESGRSGGYPEKAEAAAACGVTVLTLRRPVEEGVTAEEAMERIVSIEMHFSPGR